MNLSNFAPIMVKGRHVKWNPRIFTNIERNFGLFHAERYAHAIHGSAVSKWRRNRQHKNSLILLR